MADPVFSNSLWAATAPAAPATRALEDDTTADVAIIGGGYTGLSCALTVARGGAKAVVLEADVIGYGASGRNNGQVIPTLSRIDPDDVPGRIPQEAGGAAKGEQLVQLVADSAKFTFDLIRKHGIECEAVQNGWVQPMHSPGRMKLAQKRVKAWGRRGAPVELLDRTGVEGHHRLEVLARRLGRTPAEASSIRSATCADLRARRSVRARRCTRRLPWCRWKDRARNGA